MINMKVEKVSFHGRELISRKEMFRKVVIIDSEGAKCYITIV